MDNHTIKNRLVALDWMRGLVMMLMALDHASAFYNPDRLAIDSAATYSHGTFLALDQFLTRWITHLCAPTFIFLTGTSLALSCRQRRLHGISEKIITRDILIRGSIIATLDIILLSYLRTDGFLLQVLYAIGLSMIAIALLRQLSSRVLFVTAVLWFLCGEALTRVWWVPLQGNPPLWVGLTMAPFYSKTVTIIYPVIPWLAVMLLGLVFGRTISHQSDLKQSLPSVMRLLISSGILLLFVFLMTRGANGYGNMLLLRGDESLAQWLHVSKYPPSLSYISLELGLMAILLALFLCIERRIKPSNSNPFLVFGQTALFFYIFHLFILGAPAVLFDLAGKGTLVSAYYAAFIGLMVLYPICLGYRRYKFAHPHSWVRFI